MLAMDNNSDTLEQIYAEYGSNHSFDHLKKDATQLVKGHGPIDPLLIFIGEAPGKQEDQSGQPFMGNSGRELDKYLESIGIDRADVFITNIVKYRPKDNRDPSMGEILRSQPYIERELSVLDCPIVCTLGRHALSVFFPELQLSRVHGQVQNFGGKFLVPLFHPAVGLYNPPMKQTIFADYKKVADLLDSLVPNSVENRPTGE